MLCGQLQRLLLHLLAMRSSYIHRLSATDVLAQWATPTLATTGRGAGTDTRISTTVQQCCCVHMVVAGSGSLAKLMSCLTSCYIYPVLKKLFIKLSNLLHNTESRV
jgi:hypothetical protein